ncbi:hypothetical protein D3C87_1216810 [compost metagenome]
MQHSHSSTAQPGKSYCAIFEKMALKSTCPSPSERKRPARLIQLWKPPYTPCLPVGLNSASFTWKSLMRSW